MLNNNTATYLKSFKLIEPHFNEIHSVDSCCAGWFLEEKGLLSIVSSYSFQRAPPTGRPYPHPYFVIKHYALNYLLIALWHSVSVNSCNSYLLLMRFLRRKKLMSTIYKNNRVISDNYKGLEGFLCHNFPFFHHERLKSGSERLTNERTLNKLSM